MFSVVYYKDGQRRHYNVDFGSDETMPSCSCPDWKMSAYLWKHFFAIFKKYASWDWNSLSELYKNSPYLTLDEHVTDSTEFETQPVNKNENDEIAHRENETISKTSDTVTLEELPSKKIKVKNRVNGDTCRSLLNDVKSLSFLIEKTQSCFPCVKKSKRRNRMRSSQGKRYSINAQKITQFIFNPSLEKATWENSTSQTEN